MSGENFYNIHLLVNAHAYTKSALDVRNVHLRQPLLVAACVRLLITHTNFTLDILLFFFISNIDSKNTSFKTCAKK